jgi:hypothetical protein
MSRRHQPSPPFPAVADDTPCLTVGALESAQTSRHFFTETTLALSSFIQSNQTDRTNLLSNEPGEQNERTESNRTNSSGESSLHLSQCEQENQYLRREKDTALERAVSAENRLQTALDSIGGLTKQIDHLTQLLAMSQKTTQQLTEQNQLLLEDHRTRKVPFWRRFFG